MSPPIPVVPPTLLQIHYAAGFYILGLHGQQWVDWLGLLIFLGVLAGVSGHGVIRFVDITPPRTG